MFENPNFIEDIYCKYFEAVSPHFYQPDCYDGGTESFFFKLPPWFVKIAVKHQNEDIRSLVAGNMEAAGEYWEQLAEDESRQVRTAIAHHPLAPADILKKLASDRELDVRAAIASNIETPISVLEQLATEESEVGEIAENRIAEIGKTG